MCNFRIFEFQAAFAENGEGSDTGRVFDDAKPLVSVVRLYEVVWRCFHERPEGLWVSLRVESSALQCVDCFTLVLAMQGWQ